MVEDREVHRWGIGSLRGLPVVFVTVIAMLIAVPAAQAVTPETDITSAGPLTDIAIGNELSCQVSYTDDSSFEFYPPTGTLGDCGTFLVTGGELYAPDFVNHPAGTATESLGDYTPFTPVSQSAVTGSGTSASPYQITTTATAGTTGLTITEVDSYVVGDESYRTDVTVSNSGSSAVSALLYRAGDCYLEGSDDGYGFVDPTTNAPACTENANNSPPGQIQEFVPITGGIHYVETYYNTLWTDIGSLKDLPDTCDCATDEDNAAGINWDITVPAGGSVTYSDLTDFSSGGALALTTSKTADSSTATAGSSDGYTITISNPNSSSVSLTDITDTLPAGFTYTTGSSSGATTSDPSISGSTNASISGQGTSDASTSGQALTWTGPFTVPASGTLSLHFGVTVSSTPDTYYNNAGGDSTGFTVSPTGPTAPVTVTASKLALTTSKTADLASVGALGQDGYTITIHNPNAGAASLTDITDALASGFSYVAGSTTGASTSNPTISGQDLTWTGPFSVPGDGSVTLHFDVTAPSTGGGPFYDNAGGSASGGVTVTPTGPTAPVTVTGSGTSTACNAGKTCTTTLTTTTSTLLVAAGPGSSGTLTETVDAGTPLECSGYTPFDPNWYGFVESATNRGKLLVYTLKNTGPNVSALHYCFGAPYPFKTRHGGTSVKTTLPSGSIEYTGLLPHCRPATEKGPCILARTAVHDSSVTKRFDTLFVVAIPAGLPGDPRGRA